MMLERINGKDSDELWRVCEEKNKRKEVRDG